MAHPSANPYALISSPHDSSGENPAIGAQDHGEQMDVPRPTTAIATPAAAIPSPITGPQAPALTATVSALKAALIEDLKGIKIKRLLEIKRRHDEVMDEGKSSTFKKARLEPKVSTFTTPSANPIPIQFQSEAQRQAHEVAEEAAVRRPENFKYSYRCRRCAVKLSGSDRIRDCSELIGSPYDFPLEYLIETRVAPTGCITLNIKVSRKLLNTSLMGIHDGDPRIYSYQVVFNVAGGIDQSYRIKKFTAKSVANLSQNDLAWDRFLLDPVEGHDKVKDNLAVLTFKSGSCSLSTFRPAQIDHLPVGVKSALTRILGGHGNIWVNIYMPTLPRYQVACQEWLSHFCSPSPGSSRSLTC